jgi:hypothetical protein
LRRRAGCEQHEQRRGPGFGRSLHASGTAGR